MDSVLQDFGDLVDKIGPNLRSVIVKVQTTPIGTTEVSLGKMSRQGSYVAAYTADQYPEANRFFDETLIRFVIQAHTKFLELQLQSHSKKRTLFLRYNRAKGTIEAFTSANMYLESKLTNLLLF